MSFCYPVCIVSSASCAGTITISTPQTSLALVRIAEFFLHRPFAPAVSNRAVIAMPWWMYSPPTAPWSVNCFPIAPSDASGPPIFCAVPPMAPSSNRSQYEVETNRELVANR